MWILKHKVPLYSCSNNLHKLEQHPVYCQKAHGWGEKISLMGENEGKIDHLVWLVFGAISHDDNLHPSTCLRIIVKKL